MKMIKLIVTDMDGCLLNNAGLLPSDFAETIHMMEEQGVLLAAASGRSIEGLKRPFGALAPQMAFLSDNGACAYHKGERLFSHTITKEDYLPVLEEAGKHEGLIPVVCGVSATWLEDTSELPEKMLAVVRKYYPEWKECKYEEIPEEVIKLALLYFDDIEKYMYP